MYVECSVANLDTVIYSYIYQMPINNTETQTGVWDIVST